MKGALAIFVKTPGTSPVKTRLAKDIGLSAALEFYEHALKAVESTAIETNRQSNGLLHPWWAVGEPDTLKNPRWSRLPVCYTGSGNLGERLHHVYSLLLKDYDFVLMMGSDSPQISPDLLVDAISKVIESDEYVLGPARDGGFYLLGGTRQIPRAHFLVIPYSQSDTGEYMRKALEISGPVHIIEKLTDVDTAADLKILLNELEGAALPEQLALKEWLKSRISLEKSSLAE